MTQTNLTGYKNDLEKLIKLGDELLRDLASRSKANKKDIKGSFEHNYQRWYTEGCAVLRHLLPDRLPEFQQVYLSDTKRKAINVMSYSIQDWLSGLRVTVPAYDPGHFDDFGVTVMRVQLQTEILKSVAARFESTLFDIKQLVQADLFDSELDASRELLSAGFLRGAGALAGVVIEKHLAQACANHGIAISKKNPTISDFNDSLKNSSAIDVPVWRFIQRLGDLRNLAVHGKQREPTEAEIGELIEGVDKITKTVY